MNYLFDDDLHLFRRENTGEFAYSDGAESEARLLNVVLNAKDRSTFSPALAEAITDWVSEYHFSKSRHCLVRPLGIQAGDKVLELGCGCGPITRFLGELGANLVGVEGSLVRARVAAERCREFGNVRVVVDNLFRFETDEQFDCVLLIGVLEYAAMFSTEENPFERLVQSASRFLSPGGRLVVAIENKLGLKYFNGCYEDHVGAAFFGVQDLYGARTPRTFGRRELIDLLSTAGLKHTYFYYPFPDYKLPVAILSEDALMDGDFDPVDLLTRCHARDYTGFPYRSFDDALVLSSLHRNGLIADLSNSFLVEAMRDPKPPGHKSTLAAAYAVQRKPELAAQTRFSRARSTIQVSKEYVVSGASHRAVTVGGKTIAHDLADAEYRPGRQILWNLLKARARNANVEDIVQALLPWFDFLLQHAQVSSPQVAVGPPTLASYMLPGDFIDCTPFNLLDKDGELTYIDIEWHSDCSVSLGWIITRGILYSLTAGVPVASQLPSIAEVMEALCGRVGVSASASQIQNWLNEEADFQSAVSGRASVPATIKATSNGLRSFAGEIASLNRALTAREGQIASQSEAIANLRIEGEREAKEHSTLLATHERTVSTLAQTVEEASRLRAEKERLTGELRIETERFAREQTALQAQLRDLEESYRGLEASEQQVRRELHSQSAILRQIYSSHGWRALSVYYKCRDNFLSPRSWRKVARLPKRGIQLIKDLRLVSGSGLFDRDWYLQRNPDVAEAGVNPVRHYVRRGGAEGRDPNPLFDSDWYLQQYPDVAQAGENPLVHYLRHGATEGRDPNPIFDSDWYLQQNPDVGKAGINPLTHYLRNGAAEGRDPSSGFSAKVYLRRNPEVAKAKVNPLAHYLHSQARQVGDDAAKPSGAQDKRKDSESARRLPEAQEKVLFSLQRLERARPAAQIQLPTGARRLICVSHVLPYPSRAGNEYRIHRMLTWLSNSGYQVFLVVCPLGDYPITSQQLADACTAYPDLILCQRDGTILYQLSANDAVVTKLAGVEPRHFERELGEESDDFPISRELLPVLRTFCPDVLIELLLHLDSALQPDVFLFEYIFMMRPARLMRAGPLRVTDTHDVFSVKRDKVVQFGVAECLEVKAQDEASLLERSDLIIAIQSEEASELRRLVPGKPVITAGIDFDPVETNGTPSPSPAVLMVASDNPLNVKGLRDFLRFAWPLITRDVPGAEFRVVGAVGRKVDTEDPSVKVLGLVDDLSRAYAEAWVVINPAVAGTGLKIKTVESICHLRPVVVWPSGLEGLDAEARAFCRVATNWYEFARHVIDLCRTTDGAGDLINRRNEIFEHFSPAATYRELGVTIDSMLADSAVVTK